jgi:hypothetical protein
MSVVVATNSYRRSSIKNRVLSDGVLHCQAPYNKPPLLGNVLTEVILGQSQSYMSLQSSFIA